MECLLDTGALRTRMSAELAPLAGIELDGAPTEEFFVAGLRTAGAACPCQSHRDRRR
jgi:hypothetical protein